MRARILCLAFLIACGGTYGGKPKVAKPDGKAPKGGIEHAALPYSILDARNGRHHSGTWSSHRSLHTPCVHEIAG